MLNQASVGERPRQKADPLEIHSHLYLLWPEGSRNCTGIDHDQSDAGIVDLRERDIQERPIAHFELKSASALSLFERLNRSAQESKDLEVDSDRNGQLEVVRPPPSMISTHVPAAADMHAKLGIFGEVPRLLTKKFA